MALASPHSARSTRPRLRTGGSRGTWPLSFRNVHSPPHGARISLPAFRWICPFSLREPFFGVAIVFDPGLCGVLSRARLPGFVRLRAHDPRRRRLRGAWASLMCWVICARKSSGAKTSKLRVIPGSVGEFQPGKWKSFGQSRLSSHNPKRAIRTRRAISCGRSRTRCGT